MAAETVMDIGPLRRFRGYPEYRASGVEWLEEVPSSWQVAPLYARYEVALGKMLDSSRMTGESLGSYVRNIDVQWDRVNTENLPQMDFSATERDRYRLLPGDLLVCEGGEVGRAALWRGDLDECFYQKAIHRVRPRREEDSPRFLYYVMFAVAKRGIFVAGGNPNTIDHLTAVQLRHYRFPFPPSPEQHAIVAFLDGETARIDDLLAKKERLIELLQEKRAALVTRAVTKGLDPDVAMKDSGVEWLGEIPAHWDVASLKRAITFQRGHDLPAEQREAGAVPLVSSAGVSSTHSVSVAAAPGIVTGRYGTIGQFHLITEDYWPLNTTLYSIDLHGNHPKFLLYMLESISPLFMLNAVKSAVPGVDRNDIHAVPIGVPPPDEQEMIAEFLDNRAAQLDALITKIQTAIAHLHDLRTALISAAVTGKIDVREEAA